MKHLIQEQMVLLIYGSHEIKLSKSKSTMMVKKPNLKSQHLKMMELVLPQCSFYRLSTSLKPLFGQALFIRSLKRGFLKLMELVNFIIRIDSQSDTICSFVEPFLTTYSTESADCGNDVIHISDFHHMDLYPIRYYM